MLLVHWEVLLFLGEVSLVHGFLVHGMVLQGHGEALLIHVEVFLVHWEVFLFPVEVFLVHGFLGHEKVLLIHGEALPIHVEVFLIHGRVLLIHVDEGKCLVHKEVVPLVLGYTMVQGNERMVVLDHERKDQHVRGHVAQQEVHPVLGFLQSCLKMHLKHKFP